MASVNKKVREYTENEVGTKVAKISPEKMLGRMVLANMLFEDQFYVDGVTSAKILKDLVSLAKPQAVADLALRARTDYKLRHIPLQLMRELARTGKLKAEQLTSVIQRPDEMGEFVAQYWAEKKEPLSNQVKKGLAACFNKFNEYQLAKWDKNSAAIRIRDVLFMTHAKPKDEAQVALFKKIADDSLATPDTWEVELSGGADKAATFIRLMEEKKLGALAFLRNLRNMTQASVPEQLIRSYAKTLDVSRVLPFRFLSAAKYVPKLEDMLEAMMFRAAEQLPKLKGRTVLVIDTSGSMHGPISGKSELNRLEAAGALAILAREMCEEVVIYATAGNDGRRTHATMAIPPRRGFALSNFITSTEVSRKIGGGGIFLVDCMDYIAKEEAGNDIERVLVFTDEQDCGGNKNPASAKRPGKFNNIMNIAAYKNGINSAAWETVSGFSEAVLEYVRQFEQLD